jgi:hypothetical protein
VLAHESNREPEAPAQNKEIGPSGLANWTIRFCRFPMAVKGTVDTG